MKYTSLLRKILFVAFVLAGNNIFAQNLNIPTLPAGDSIIVISSVTINSPFTNVPSQLSKQHTISGANFSTVVSNDPKTVAANDATITPVVTVAGSDLSITKTDSPDPVVAGNNLTYTITLSNLDATTPAATVSVQDVLPAGVTFVSLATPVNWSSTTPAVGGTGTVTITKASLANADGLQTFTLVVNVNAGTANGTVISNTATVTTTTTESNSANNTATSTTTVTAPTSDLSITKTDSPDPVVAGNNLTYTITLSNLDVTTAAQNVSVSDVLPTGVTFVSLATPVNWSSTTPAVGGTGTVTITKASLANADGLQTFTLVVNVNSGVANGTTLSNTATVTTTTAESNTANNSATATTNVTGATAPVVTTSVGSTTYTAAPVAVDPNITVTDADNTTLASGTVTVTNVQAGDALFFTNSGMGNISVSGSGTSTITLTSAGATATVAQWQAALRAITFSTSSGNTTSRTISFVVNDGTNSSSAATKTITFPGAGSLITDYYRTRQSGNWNDVNTWESSSVSDFSSGVTSPATLTPDFNANTITVLNTHTITITANLTTDQTTVNSAGAVIVNPNIVLTVNNGTGTDITVSSGGSFTLKSTAAGTASIGNSAGTTSGNFTIERYIPARRAWRFITAPISSTGAPTINASWQEGVTTASGNPNTNAGFGTHITGGIVANGFDQNAGNSPSLKIYNPSTNGATDQNNWVGIATTLTPITGQQGYMLFVRGSRANNLGQGTAAVADNTTLRVTGQLRSGDQNVGIAATGWTVVGNPYASPVNLNSLAKTNGSTNVADNFYVWDPKMAGSFGVGAYVNLIWNPGTSSYDITPTPVSAVSQFIQSSQAFFATSTGSAGNLVIKETDKSASGSDNVFRVTSGAEEKIRTNLYSVNADGSTSIVDGTLNSYSNIFSNSVDKFDAAKLTNFGENIGIVNNGKTLIVERRNVIGDDINFKIWQMNQQDYQFEIMAENVDAANLTAFLQDKYLKNTTPLNLSGTTKIKFSVTADAGSAAGNRFSIVFGKPAVITGTPAIVISPNPVTDGIINLRLNNMPQGNYNIRLINNLGQVVLSRQINHVQGSSVEKLGIPGKGVYHVEVTKPDNTKFSGKVIAN